MKSEKDDMQTRHPRQKQKNRAENPAPSDEQTSRFESSTNRGKNEKEEKSNPRTNERKQTSDKPAELSPKLTAEFTKHRLQVSPPDAAQPLPARMLNEFVYCPRLFYYEYVEGVFLHNADTRRGSALHKRVDAGKGALPPADSNDDSEPETIHSRSVTISSEQLRVIAKMDLIEVRNAPAVGQTGDLFAKREVTPVDYKAGAPREGQDQNEIWDTDKMQLGVQILILRDNGYLCREGVIYYCATRQRVRRQFTPEWEQWVRENIAAARQCCAGPIPPPLDHSPKCVRCSLAPVCLPDETRYLMPSENDKTLPSPKTDPAAANGKVRRLIAARDDKRPLYLDTQGLKIGRKSETLQIKEHGKLIDDVRLNHVNHVALFGNIQISTQAVQSLCYAGIPLTYFSVGGWFYGLTRGHHQKNVFLRIQQFHKSAQPDTCIQLARQFVEGKIRNQRTLLRRNHVEAPAEALSHLKQSAHDAQNAPNLPILLGIEGAAAALYFKHFAGMIKPQESSIEEETNDSPDFPFHFTERNRRPPTDPVNALLSLAYSLLAKDCAIAAYSVGFDPYVGFFHQPRFGRPALALDLMEEFRPIIAESVVITAINNRVIHSQDFVRAGNAVNLTPAGRKKFIQTYEQRMSHLLTHPLFQYKVCYRRAIELQARILARVLEEQFSDYKPLTTR